MLSALGAVYLFMSALTFPLLMALSGPFAAPTFAPFYDPSFFISPKVVPNISISHDPAALLL